MEYLYYPGCTLVDTARSFDRCGRAAARALDVELIEDKSVLILEPAGELEAADFDRLSAEVDPYIERTRDRPIASGAVRPLEALTLFAALGFVAVGLATMLNRPAQLLAVVAAGLTIAYPFFKRFVSIPQFILGAAFGWAAPMAYAAQANELTAVTWLIFLATVLWATVYDTMYAMVDREDDLALGVKSTAILFGDSDRQIVGLLQVMVLLCLLMIGRQAELGGIYYLGVLMAAGLFAYQQFLIRFRTREGCFQAFLNNNWVGAAVFLGILLDYMLA